MNFNIHLDCETQRLLGRAAEQSGASRNAVIRMAPHDWLARRGTPEWPDEVLSFKGLKRMPPFEAYRRGLKPSVRTLR